MNYPDALSLMHEYTQSEALRRHMYAVETSMRAYARKFHEDEELWAVTGLLHDFDYERFPNPPEHPVKGSEILKDRSYPDEVITAILGHAEYTGVPRTSLVAKVLFACDELCGFLTAVSVIRPNKIADLEVASVKKKMKDKGFAKNVSRDDIMRGANELGVSLEEHIQFLIDAMRLDSKRLGLD
jgi:putative nucleotidyltransferase with HDIG domain